MLPSLQHWQAAGAIEAIDTVAVPHGADATVDTVLAAFARAFDAAAARGVTYDLLFVSHVLTTTGLRLPLA